MKKVIAFKTIILTLFMTGTAWSTGVFTGTNITFHGRVIAPACVAIPTPGTPDIDFHQVSTRDLYSSQKTKPIPFVIHLQGCNASVMKTATVTFSGSENLALPNHLKITPQGAGGASGVGIALEENNGTPIQLNKPTSATNLATANAEIAFNTYLEAEPQALKNSAIHVGKFTSSVNYIVNYQ